MGRDLPKDAVPVIERMTVADFRHFTDTQFAERVAKEAWGGSMGTQRDNLENVYQELRKVLPKQSELNQDATLGSKSILEYLRAAEHKELVERAKQP